MEEACSSLSSKMSCLSPPQTQCQKLAMTALRSMHNSITRGAWIEHILGIGSVPFKIIACNLGCDLEQLDGNFQVDWFNDRAHCSYAVVAAAAAALYCVEDCFILNCRESFLIMKALEGRWGGDCRHAWSPFESRPPIRMQQQPRLWCMLYCAQLCNLPFPYFHQHVQQQNKSMLF